ncbi:MAG TPA: hypothetical protein VFE17_00070, partial [Candidatus Baltobacteraceae bacterium]|nr:hypothetical protein [Candidatus Baltobacteraceae bacterium]
NISNARFQGIELGVRHEPLVGFGFNLSGALQRGYYYNMPKNFYCSVPVPGCDNPSSPNYNPTNLNIVSGLNTNGIPVGYYNVSFNGNMRIPYSQGNAEISYRFPNTAFVAFGMTYYGNNNSLNEPPFGIGFATIRYPITHTVDLQISGDNIFNAWPGYLPIEGGGVAIPFAIGPPGATTGNVLGPATWRFILSTRMP